MSGYTSPLQAYLERRDTNEARSMGNLQQAGALQTMLANADALRKKQAYEQEMAALPPDADEETRARTAMRHASPDVVVRTQQDALNRKDAAKDRALNIAAQLEAKQAALAQQKELALQRAQDKASQEAVLNSFRERELAMKSERDLWTRDFQRQGLDLRALQVEVAKSKADEIKAKALQGETTKLSAALEKSGLPEVDATLDAVEKALSKTPRLAEYIGGPLSATPDMAVGVLTPSMGKEEADAIRSGRQAFAKLFNITLKNRSGAAVTNQELERLKGEFAAGAFKDEKQLRAAVEQARNIISNHYASVAAGFSPEVLESYNANIRQYGGRVVIDPKGAKPAAPSPAPAPKPAGGVVKITSDAEFDALPSGALFVGPDGKQRKKP